MGNIFKMKYYISQNLVNDLKYLKELDYRIISIENNVDSANYKKLNIQKKAVIVFGNEGFGIDNEILEISDNVFHIPIMSDVGSINVSAASAIILNHIYNTIY